MKEFQAEVGEWGIKTFPHSTDLSIASHLCEEAAELQDVAYTSMHHTGIEPSRFEEECADVYLLLLHLAHRVGFSLEEAARKKFEIVKARKWDSGEERGYSKHVEVEGCQK